MSRLQFVVLALLWTMLHGLSLSWQYRQTEALSHEIAHEQAQAFFAYAVSVRVWSARHGGVYVLRTPESPPNPYLKHPRRDLETRQGLTLTMINPAYMSRQIAAIAAEEVGVQFRITSLEPLRPENAPDDWEHAALLAFQSGDTEKFARVVWQDRPYYRYMAPLPFETACLQCHPHDPDALPKTRGGISVSLPAAAFDAKFQQRVRELAWVQGALMLLGLGGLVGFYAVNRQQMLRLEKACKQARLAFIDPMTRVPNRRQFAFLLKKLWSTAIRHELPVTMMMFDLDHFKAYNDHLGHHQGDVCLVAIAETLKGFFRRPDDLFARYGGEEFCAAVVCNPEQGHKLAEQLRAAVENLRMSHPESDASPFVTVSVGVATVYPKQNTHPDVVLELADRALYQAKQQGRNRVCLPP